MIKLVQKKEYIVLTLKEFISIALNSNTRDIIYELEITEDACRAIKKHTNLNICKYKFIIEEEYIRHIRNGHEEDLELLPLIPIILNRFTSVEKSLTRNKQTGQNDVSLVFRKNLIMMLLEWCL
ncbi:hypothetical protein CPG37_06250 [Malaciobacter canalis]|uniref:Uncharacterized protein n=1 Tax=Malaciobacter canalis TaxID=1912871 RepID=A0ABX4LPT7_9BACT|nr:hypothetical protein [Malaciobacter canalis]PHO09939.1 hypothetical protein CPG37_06250 [Malaciobacter canalis]QEE33769.1 hypothetical protein ACAN_2319 [Malaciobacter canalis]